MKPRLDQRWLPVLLLLICALGFGLLIPWLGFYWDDWPVILLTRLRSWHAFWGFYQYDRPFSAWTYILTAPLFGTRPWVWHVFTLALRWLSVLAMWWGLRGLWPSREREISLVALLFAIYPSFIQQPIAVAFSQHWITYGLFFLSLGGMIHAVRSPRRFWLWTPIAVLACGVHLFTMEYFLGLELLRPAFLWILHGEAKTSRGERLRRTINSWFVYLVVVVVFVIWRVFFLKLAGQDPNQPSLIRDLAAQPVATGLAFIQSAAQDVVNLLATAWTQTIIPADIDLSSTFFLFRVGVGVVGACLTAWFLWLSKSDETTQSDPKGEWLREATALGLAGIFLGFLPVWITARQSVEGLYASRFTLAASFGASLLIVSLLEWFTPNRTGKIILIAAMVGLAISFHLKNANDYRWSWITQQRFYWQLFWRAPYIEANTAFLSDGELFPYVGVYSTTTGLNLLYPQPPIERANEGGSIHLAYWFYSLRRGLYRQTPQLLKGMTLKPSFRTFRFDGSSHQSLVIFYEPAEGRCLWVLGADDQSLPELPEMTKQVLPISDLGRINVHPPEPNYPPKEIFGDELAHTWCYYFQKAELANQVGDWQEAARLGAEAKSKGYETSHYRELKPFIEAYARLGNWDQALAWTLSLDPKGANVKPVCALWKQLSAETPAGESKDASVKAIFQSFQCTP